MLIDNYFGDFLIGESTINSIIGISETPAPQPIINDTDTIQGFKNTYTSKPQIPLEEPNKLDIISNVGGVGVLIGGLSLIAILAFKIGRASCRERV